ncbi:uncharacterized protein LOC115630031 [Scaptodrosophila lebanonensis]|uniref:Uncharacterized protein LOC115630031 n=1 Tax=Drosophila lebanonensis TaxID=7225 RepID=A0A6J2U2B3_DROLE|nr:uncharacterized protein LOC115630031 [Scaptodrosophila lebanonensis]
MVAALLLVNETSKDGARTQTRKNFEYTYNLKIDNHRPRSRRAAAGSVYFGLMLHFGYWAIGSHQHMPNRPADHVSTHVEAELTAASPSSSHRRIYVSGSPYNRVFRAIPPTSGFYRTASIDDGGYVP